MDAIGKTNVRQLVLLDWYMYIIVHIYIGISLDNFVCEIPLFLKYYWSILYPKLKSFYIYKNKKEQNDIEKHSSHFTHPNIKL